MSNTIFIGVWGILLGWNLWTALDPGTPLTRWTGACAAGLSLAMLARTLIRYAKEQA